MQEEWKIYMHTNLINGKVYIGQTRTSLRARFGKNGIGYKGCKIFYNAIKKYGWDNFSHQILEEHILTQEEANKKEKKYIMKYKSDNSTYGYNISKGGGDCGHSGKVVYCYSMNGKYLKEYESLSKAERLLKICHGKIASCCSGKRKSAGGYRWSYEKKEYIGEYKTSTTSKPVYQYSLDGEFIKGFDTVVEAVNEMRIEKNGMKIKNGAHISSCCNGNRETAYGYQWKYEYYDHIEAAKNTRKQGYKVIQFSDNGDIIKIHENCVKASEQFGDKKDKAYFSIARCCQGRNKTAYGYKWEYLD